MGGYRGGKDEEHRHIDDIRKSYILSTYQVSIGRGDGGVKAKRRGRCGSVVGEGGVRVVASGDEEVNAGGGKGDEGEDPKDHGVGR